MLLLKLKISGHSMQPIIKNGGIVIVSSIPYMFKNPKIGDIVAFKYKHKIFIKRIKLIKQEKYFMQGDNKNDSMDSRSLGFVFKKQILGKVIYKH